MTINNLDIEEEQLREICKKYLIKELALFGSALRKDFTENSDIDLLVEFMPDSGITIFNIVDLRDEFEKLFRRPVDLVSRSAIERSRNKYRKEEILKNTKVIYAA